MYNILNLIAYNLIKGLLSLFIEFHFFILSPNIFIMKFVGSQLNWMIVMTQQLQISIDLISKSPLLHNL